MILLCCIFFLFNKANHRPAAPPLSNYKTILDDRGGRREGAIAELVGFVLMSEDDRQRDGRKKHGEDPCAACHPASGSGSGSAARTKVTCDDARTVAMALAEQAQYGKSLSLATELYIIFMIGEFCLKRVLKPAEPRKWRWAQGCEECAACTRHIIETHLRADAGLLDSDSSTLHDDAGKLYIAKYLDLVETRVELIRRQALQLVAPAGLQMAAAAEAKVGELQVAMEAKNEALQTQVDDLTATVALLISKVDDAELATPIHSIEYRLEKLEESQAAQAWAMPPELGAAITVLDDKIEALKTKEEKDAIDIRALFRSFQAFVNTCPECLPRPVLVQSQTANIAQNQVVVGFACCEGKAGCHFPWAGCESESESRRLFLTVQTNWEKWVKYSMLATHGLETAAGIVRLDISAVITVCSEAQTILRGRQEIIDERLKNALRDSVDKGRLTMLASSDFDEMLSMLKKSCFFDSFKFCADKHDWRCNWCHEHAEGVDLDHLDETRVAGEYHGTLLRFERLKPCKLYCKMAGLYSTPHVVVDLDDTDFQEKHEIPLNNVIGLVDKPNASTDRRTFDLIFWDPDCQRLTRAINVTNLSEWQQLGGFRRLTFSTAERAQAAKRLIMNNIAVLSNANELRVIHSNFCG